MRPSLLVLLAACAGGGSDMPVDAGKRDATVDVMLTDGPPLVTLSQTTSTQLEAATSRACLGMPNGSAANNYYRVFDLAAAGITSDFHVTKLSFQVEHCHEFASSAGATLTARIGTYASAPGPDTLVLADMTIQQSVSAFVPEVIESGSPPMTPGGTVDAYFDTTIAAGQRLLVEVDAPDGSGDYIFLMGANNDGESAPGYVLAPSCMATVPTNISTIANTPVHLLMTVSGWY